jgi:sucrose-6-phosphate hydrolase SacC (GH32 family)
MKIIYIFLLTALLFLLNSCQTIENKSQSIIKKENEKLSKLLQQPESELKIVMGEPDEIIHDDKGSKFFVYTQKKYSITCERKFEINETKMVVGFTSKGCF